MPLDINSAVHDPVFVLSEWKVKEPVPFTKALAWLYLRKPHHATRIIQALAPGEAGLFGNSVQNAITLLKVNLADIAADLLSSDPDVRSKAEKKREVRISHRDGLLFQHVSWLAARMKFPSAKTTPPHVRQADKGFDGFLVEYDAAQDAVSKIVLCEDKASTDPRALVTSRVWPEIRSIVACERDLEILDALTALLDNVPEAHREKLIKDIIWDRARCFRVALAVGPNDIKNGSYTHLFDGFDAQVSGDVETRQGEVMPLPDVRQYLDDLAKKVIAELEAMQNV